MKIRSSFAFMGILAALFFLLTSAPLLAQDKEEHMGPPSDQKMEANMAEGEKAAGLTQDQRDKLKALREEFRSKQKPMREQMKAKHEALRQELDSPNPDRAKAESIAREIDALKSQATANRIDETFKVRGILTPEQFQKLHAFHEKKMENMKGKMKGRMGNKGMHGPWHNKGGMSGDDHGDK